MSDETNPSILLPDGTALPRDVYFQKFNAAFVDGLCRMVDDLAKSAIVQDGFAYLKQPADLKTSLASTWRTFGDDAWDSFDGLENLGLSSETLIDMEWTGGPGTSSFLSFYRVQLPTKKFVYMLGGDLFDEQMLLAVVTQNWNPHVDRKFLQYLFRGRCDLIGGSALATPPNVVASCLLSFLFLIDLFVLGFDSADSWHALLKDYEIWDEKYENPEDPRETATAPQAKHEMGDFNFAQKFERRLPTELDSKLRIVARYLSQVLRESIFAPPNRDHRLPAQRQ